MHLHASHEPTASIGSHMCHARELNIPYIWITEHDVRMGRKKRPLDHFEFKEKKLFGEQPYGVRAGFKKEEGNTGKAEFSENDGRIELKISASRGERESLFFYSKGKNHSDPLFSKIAVLLDADIDIKDGAGLSLEFILSAQPPSYLNSRLIYTVGDVDIREGGEFIKLLFPEKGKDGLFRFEITEDASEKVGGLDNALCYIRINLFGKTTDASILFRSFDFLREKNFEEVRAEQIKVASEVGKKWGVTPFVSYEISDAGHHKNVYSTRVPVMDYREREYKISEEESVRHVLSHGAIFSYNHPFTEWKNEELSDADRDGVVKILSDKLCESRVLGASVMEVGFPYEKENFYDRHYLALWDELSKRGVFITGDGDSDCHHATADGWTEGNNFVTYTGLYHFEEPREENFVKAFVRGSVFAGNPTVCGNIEFSAEGYPLGSVFSEREVKTEISVSGFSCEGTLIRIVNGNVSEAISLSGGRAKDAYTLTPCEKFNFIRYEIRNKDGILVAITNPIYLAKRDSDIYEGYAERVVTR